MDVFDSNGTKLEYSAVLANLPITESCEHVEELMKADHIVLSWRDSEKYTLPVGAYITYKGVNYALLEPYEPEQKRDDEFEYTPNFQHPKMYLGKVPFRFPTTDTEGNSITLLEWPYSGDIDTLLTFFCRTMESVLGLTANTFNYSILGEIDMVVSTTFNTEDILSALTNVANKLKCEWHIDWDYKILYFGHIELSRDEVDETVLEVGVNVGMPSVRSSKEGFYNTYEPQGSTRNISKRAASGEYVQGDVRLALNETDYPDKVIYTNESGTVIASLPQGVKKYVKPLIFDNVFPKLDLYVYDVRCRERDLLDDNGEKIIDHYDGSTPVYKRYAVWYMRLAYATKVAGHVTQWHDYDIISGKNLGGAFQPNTYEGAESFPLAGRGQADDGGYGFELIYHSTGETIPASGDDTGVVIKAGDYEIVFQQQNDYILPTTATQGIIPKGVKVGGQEVTDLNSLTNLDDGQKGNIVDLYNIVIDNRYNESAQNDLAQETLKYIANQFKDNNSYTLKSDVVAFKKRIDQDELLHTDSSLYIGEKVIYKNGDYELETRVMKLTTKLDYAFEQEIVVGNEILKGTQTTLKEQVQTILSGGTGSGGGIDSGAVRKIVQAYTNPRFLSKIEDDTAQGFIKMLKGLQIGSQDVEEAILGEGGLFQMGADGKVHLITDSLYVRMRAYFDSVVIREYKHESGNRIVSPAQGFNASRVEYIKVVNNEETIVENPSEADYFRCYWRVDDGEKKAENQFVIGDLAFCEHSDVVNGSLVTKRYWRVVTGRNAGNTTTADGEAWIDLSNAHDGNGAPVMTTISWTGQGGTTETLSVLSFERATNGYPEAHDDISMLGCVVDATRQGAIIEYVSGVNAPAYQIYQGLGADASNPYSLNNKNQISIGFNSQTQRAEMNVFGDAYIGARDRSTFIEYKQDDGTQQHAPVLNIKAHVEFTNSDQELDGLVQSHQRDDSYDDTEVRGLISGLQEQIDGQIETWFYNYSPVNVDASGAPTSNVPLNVAPYSDWDTDDKKIAHLGDTFTNNSTGYCWRFSRNSETNAFEWVIIEDSAVIAALQNASRAQETADHKRRVFLCDSTHQTPTPPYDEGDLWVNVKYPWATGETYDNEILKCVKSVPRTEEEQEVTTFSIDDWSVANGYTAKYNSIINNQYYQQLTSGTISANIRAAADAASNAATAASNAATAASNAQSSANAANNALSAWADDGKISPTEILALLNQEEDVKAEYTQILADAGRYEAITTAQKTAFTDAYNAAIAAFDYHTDLENAGEDGCIVIIEDDTDENYYGNISAYYTARQIILNLIAAAAKDYAETLAAAAADAFKSDAVYRALKSALGSKTDIVGGLVLTSLIGMRQNTGTAQSPVYTTWGGISGEYDTLAKGGGIAAWYGGDMFDREDVDDSSSDDDSSSSSSEEEEEPRYATSLFRFDGSGYLASGNITWNDQGQITIKNITTLSDSQNTNLLNELATFNSAFHFTTEGQGGTTILSIDPQVQFSTLHIGGSTDDYLAATRKWVGDNYISKTWFNKFFKVHYKNNGTDAVLDPNNDFPAGATDKNIEAIFSFWTNYAISALGQGVDGSHAIGVLDDLSDVTISNPAVNQILKYDGTQWVNAAAPQTYVLPQATSGALGGIKIGYNDATPKTYAVALNRAGQAYVAVPWSDTTYTNGTGLALSGNTFSINSTYQTYISNGNTAYGWGNHANAGYALASSLSNYLPLSGGTMTGNITMSANSIVFNDNHTSDWNVGNNSGLRILNTVEASATGGIGIYSVGLSVSGYYKFQLAANGGGGSLKFRNGKRNSYDDWVTLIDSSTIGSQSVSYASSAGDASTLGGTAKSGLFTALSSDATTKLSITIGGTTKTLSTLYASHAAQLTTSCSLWGNSFNGTADITSSIIISTPKSGETDKYIQIGDIKLVYDSSNEAIKVVHTVANKVASLWAEGGIAALGSTGSGGGGGGQGDVTWELLVQSDTRQINISHLAGDSNYVGVLSVLTGYTTSGKNYKVQEDSNHHLYVNVPWTDTTYSAGTGISLSGTTFSNSGVRATTINGNYLRVNTNGTNADLTIPYATSAGDADTVDGYHESSFYRDRANETPSGDTSTFGVGSYSYTSVSGTSLPEDFGNYIVLATNSATYAPQLYMNNNASRLWLRSRVWNGNVSEWHQFAFVDSNVASATKLQTARTINGTSFDGTTDVTTANWGTARNISIADSDSTNTGMAVSVNGSAAVTLKLPSTIKATLSGNAATATTASKLSTVSKTAWGQTFWTSDGVPTSISGALSSVTNITMSGYIKIGSIYIGEDSNGDLEIYKLSNGSHVAANMYARGGVSALGSSGSGGGGGQGDVTWTLLASTRDTTDRTINISYLTESLDTLTSGSNDGTNKNYAVKKNGSNQLYVNVPWTDTTYTLAGLMGSSAKGGATQPIYWNGSAFVNTSYTLGKSVPSDAKFTDTTYTIATGDSNGQIKVTPSSGSAYNVSVKGLGSNAYTSTAYLPLSGGTMSGNIVMGANAVVFSTGHTSDWANPRGSGIRILNTVGGAGEGAPTQYSVGLSVSGYYGFQLSCDHATNVFSIRSTSDGSSTSPWVRILHSSNYTTYTVTQNGTGASGTWGIGITGNAASATKLETARTIWGQNFDGTGNVSGAITGVTTISTSSDVSVGGTLNVSGSINGTSVLYNGNACIHAGNIGSQSVNYATSAGNADTVDGYHASGFYMQKSVSDSSTDISTLEIGAYGFTSIIGTNSVPTSYGTLMVLSSSSSLYRPQLYMSSDAKRLWLRARVWNGTITDWHEMAFLDSNVASATKLQTARTIWGQSFDGSANISGSITGATNVEGSGYGRFGGASGIYIGATYAGGSAGFDCIERAGSGNTLYFHYYHAGNVSICVGGGSVGIGYSSPSYKLDINGSLRNTTSAYLATSSSGNVGIGTTSPSYKLHVNGESYFENWMYVNSSVTALGIELRPSSSSAGHGGHIDFHFNQSSADYTTRLIEDASGRLKLIGDFYATGGVTALVATSSDIRKKNVVSYDLPLTLNQIAKAPTIKFTWKDNAKLGEQVGSIAQYWQKVLPQTIRTEKDNTLSLQYGVAALVSSIITARKVVDHEKRITELEKERDAWKEAYSFIKNAYEELKLKIA